ncbi:MAG: aspartate kinase [Promethearchaeota archaeon]|nr:MAG: aspartate kinase [Candidatus Lokiarchaeota archaeon]
MKFGGSCLINNHAFNKIISITEHYQSDQKIYVASAFNGVTDLLLKMAKAAENALDIDSHMALLEKRHFDIIEQIFQEESEFYLAAKDWVDENLSILENVLADIQEFGFEPYYQDKVISFGEILSTFILNQFLLSKGYDSIYIPANEIIITNDEYTNAYPYFDLTTSRMRNQIAPILEKPNKNLIICITGFIGRNKIGYTTTLGRGGSDYTATILARALSQIGIHQQIKVILWKDVDGILAIDPEFVPQSSLIKYLDYDEAKHIANFGAKVLHPKCLEAIEKLNIPLEIRNFNKPTEQDNFTTVSPKSDRDQIKGISTVQDGIIITITSGSLVDMPGILAKIFKVISKSNISVSLVAQSATEISTSFIVKKDDADIAINSLKNSEYFSEFFEIKFEEVAIINITGAKILDNQTKVRIFQAFAKRDINVKALSQSTDEINFSIVIQKEQLMDAVTVLHDDLCEEFASSKCEDNAN